MNSQTGRDMPSSTVGAAADSEYIIPMNQEKNDKAGNDKGSLQVNLLGFEMTSTCTDPPQESNWECLRNSVATDPKLWGSSAAAPENFVCAEGSSGGHDSESYTDGSEDDDDDDDDTDDDVDDDDVSVGDLDDLPGDQYDSDMSKKSHETRKKNSWFRSFFKAMDSLSATEVNRQTRRWHCPACQNGPGAIGWYKGMQPLLTHAKTKGSSRVKLHREFAELLEEELQRRGMDGEVVSRLKGVHEPMMDLQIVWPPMVVVLNTLLERNECARISGKEVCEYFKEFSVIKARHSYGHNGHLGMSVLIFEASAIGYLEAENLHKHFLATGRDRAAWKQCSLKLNECAGSQFYGYLACKEDMDIFNQLLEGKLHLKFEIRSYLEMVMNPLRQMSKDNRTLVWFKNKDIQQKQHIKSLEERNVVLSQRAPEKTEDDRISRLITGIQLDELKDEDSAEDKLSNGDAGTR